LNLDQGEMSGDKTLRSEIGAALKIEFADIKIPPRPAVLSSIEKEMRSKSPNLAALEKVISLDVGISASLLKVANSAFFGASAQIRSIKAALQILGLDLVGTTLSALYLRQAFSHVQHFERFWDSSARTAQLSGWLVNQIPPAYRKAKSEEAYTFGLFRDCGIPIMFSMLSDYFSILGRANDEAARPFTAIEDDEIGWNHAQA
jgi:HD-like signal output (HDOD) protein